MSLSRESIEKLSSHWAVAIIESKDLNRAEEIVGERLVQKAVGRQISFSFVHTEQEDDALLERVVLAYEMAAIEGLEELSRASGSDKELRDQAIAAAYSAFNIRRVLSVSADTQERLFQVFHLSALAYCGDRWSDLRRWYNENEEYLKIPSVAKVSWDCRVLYRLFDCWIRLFRKKGWDDLDRIREIVAGLRDDQKTHEESYLENGSRSAGRAVILRLVALYHWAKATEVLALYMLQGEPADVFGQIEKHFEAAVKAAAASGDAQHEMTLRWLHAAGRMMVTNSLWWATRTVNSKTSDFVSSLTRNEHRALFELLPPQRAALLEQGLLDQAKTAIVIDLPTSGGKTLLAQFRILQALNQFGADHGWVAYVAPTRALSAQITRRLRRDFEPINVKVEQLTAAVEVDAFEERLLADSDDSFDVLVSTPEKLSLVIRNRKIGRPLALVVMDEAHNLETEGRGLRIELLLATVKRDCSQANFLLLMPYVEDTESIANWLAQDISAGRAISLGTTAWKPNERIIGLYSAVADESERGGWRLNYETLTVTQKAVPLRGVHRVGKVRPIPSVSRSKVIDSKGKQKGLITQTVAMAAILSDRHSSTATSIALANNINWIWNMARHAAETLPEYETVPENVRLVQDFLRTEVSPDFELVSMLNHGVGVHNAGLSDEVRSLMEWLAENGNLKVLCATSTIAQGINFPVSSVFLASHSTYKDGLWVPMSPREFWNLAGRAGRIDHDTVGVVGLAKGENAEEITKFVSRSTGALVSRLVTLLDELAEQGSLNDLSGVFWQDQWEDFRCYIAHMCAEKKDIETVVRDSEQLLRQTYGYTSLRNDPEQAGKAEALLDATQKYARDLAKKPGIAQLADSTGFSPEGVSKAITGLGNLENRLDLSDWTPDGLFGDNPKMADLFGVMLKVPQLKKHLEEISASGFDYSHLSNITVDWVNGKRLKEIAENYFSKNDGQLMTDDLTKTCKAIYRAIVSNGTWGISALSKMSGKDLSKLTEAERFRINAVPAMVYHGVRSEDAVLMRMNSVPRSASEALGILYRDVSDDEEDRYSVSRARSFLKNLGKEDWNGVRPEYAQLSGSDYKRIWEILSGESS